MEINKKIENPYLKTLVIHPKDATTEFLNVVYSDLRGITVINENCSKAFLKKSIQENHRIIMLGHGDEKGLFGFDKHFIGSELVYLLREKYCIGVWCHANIFFEKYKLNGFYTGMIISDRVEASQYNIRSDYWEIQDSNKLFALSLCHAIAYEQIDKKMFETYGNFKEYDNVVVTFNSKNIFQNMDYETYRKSINSPENYDENQKLKGVLIDFIVWYNIEMDSIDSKSELHKIAKKAKAFV